MISMQRDGFRNPQPVPEHHHNQQMTAGAMPTRLGGGKKAIDLGEPQIVPPAFMRSGGYIKIIFDISPCRLRTGRSGNVKNTRELAELVVIETLRKAYSVKS